MFRCARKSLAARAVAAIAAVSGVAGFAERAAGQPIGEEFQINTHTAGDQTYPSVAMNSSGRFVVVWHSAGQDSSGDGVFGQRFDAAGNKTGPEFRVNTYTENDQREPSVSIREDGSFIVVWESRDQDGDGNGIFGQMFDSSGNTVGPEFQVNVWTFSNESAPHVASDRNDNFIIAWQSTLQDGSSDAAMVRKYDPNGNPLTGEIMVNTHTYGFQGATRVACDSLGNFVAAYVSWELDGDNYAAGCRRVASSGGLLGDEILANTYTAGNQDYPDVGVAPNGDFVVVWHSTLQDGHGNGVYGQRFDAGGKRVGGEFQINSYYRMNQWWAKVAVDRYGGFTVTWYSFGQDGDRHGIYARRYRANGNPHADEFCVNSHTAGDQERPSITSDPQGNLVIVWQSNGQDGDGYGIYGQRLASVSVPVTFASVAAAYEGGAVRVRWEVSDDSSPLGYDVYRMHGGRDIRVADNLPPRTIEFVDKVDAPGRYVYSVAAVEPGGAETRSRGVTVDVAPHREFTLGNHPSPFNESTTIEFTVSEEGRVTLDVFGVDGRFVRRLVDSPRGAGVQHRASWDGRDNDGKRVATGVYFYKVTSGGRTLVRKTVLIR